LKLTKQKRRRELGSQFVLEACVPRA
jgi:hypothetical protein